MSKTGLVSQCMALRLHNDASDGGTTGYNDEPPHSRPCCLCEIFFSLMYIVCAWLTVTVSERDVYICV